MAKRFTPDRDRRPWNNRVSQRTANLRCVPKRRRAPSNGLKPASLHIVAGWCSRLTKPTELRPWGFGNCCRFLLLVSGSRGRNCEMTLEPERSDAIRVPRCPNGLRQVARKCLPRRFCLQRSAESGSTWNSGQRSFESEHENHREIHLRCPYGEGSPLSSPATVGQPVMGKKKPGVRRASRCSTWNVGQRRSGITT